MTIHFKPGSLYKIVPTLDGDTYMFLDDETCVDFNTTVFLCLKQNPLPCFGYIKSFFFLCTDKNGNPHEFTMSEGSMYGDMCVEIK